MCPRDLTPPHCQLMGKTLPCVCLELCAGSTVFPQSLRYRLPCASHCSVYCITVTRIARSYPVGWVLSSSLFCR